MRRALREENNNGGGSTKVFAPSLHGFRKNFTVLLWLLGTQVYVLNGTDPEGDPVRYDLMFEKGSKEYFRLDSKSGNVTLIQELDREVSL